MKIRFNICMAGADFVRNVGDIAEIPDAEALRLIEAGIAEPVKDEQPIETASIQQQTETAAVRTSRKGRGR